MKRHIIASLLFLLPLISFAQSTARQDYEGQRDQLKLAERVPFIVETIQNETDSDTLVIALDDLLKFSVSDEENRSALTHIEAALAKLPADSNESKNARLLKAKTLRRLGDKQGEQIFKQAFEEEWGLAFYEYRRSLLETSDFDKTAVAEFRRASRQPGFDYGAPPYKDRIEELGLFKLYLSRLKANQPDVSAMESVYANIGEIEKEPLMKEMAKALCLSADGRFAEAKQAIADAETVREVLGESEDWKNIPLYKAMVLLDDGVDIAGAQAEFRNFMDAHGDNYKLIYSGGVRFARSLEKSPQLNKAKMDEVTSLLVESPIMKDPAVMATFSEYDIAHLLDLHQMGLAWSGQFDESAEICRYVFSEYFPDNLPSANCAMNLAVYLGWKDGGNPDAVKDILDLIIEKAPFVEIVPWVRLLQAENAIKLGHRFQAISHLHEAIEASLINDGGPQQDCLDAAIKLQTKILAN